MRSALIFIAAMLAFTFAAWTGPVLLFSDSRYLRAISAYRDPVTLVSHALIHNNTARQTFHVAVDDQGQILYKTIFGVTFMSHGSIQGAGDGKHLLAAIAYAKTLISSNMINFTESFDGGKTWAQAKSIGADDEERGLEDMIYIAETGRVLIFLHNDNQETRVVWRAPGSAVFSPPTFVGKPTYTTSYRLINVRATYSLWMGKPIIHVVYKGDVAREGAYYVRSNNNGVSWTTPKKAEDAGDSVSSLVGFRTLGQRVFFSYSTQVGAGSIKLKYTDDHGQSFSRAIVMRNETRDQVDTGMSVCSSKGKSALTSLLILRDNKIEYSVWNTTSLKQMPRDYPVESKRYISCAVDCNVEAERSLLNVSTFVEVRAVSDFRVYFAKDSSPLPA